MFGRKKHAKELPTIIVRPNWSEGFQIKPDTPEHIQDILWAFDEKYTVKEITRIDGDLKSFKICWSLWYVYRDEGSPILKVEKQEPSGMWTIKLAGRLACRNGDFPSEETDEIAVIFSVLREFFKLNEAEERNQDNDRK